MKPATEILLSAAFALTPEENWTQNALARTRSGDSTDRSTPYAVSWCVVGAIGEAQDALGVRAWTDVGRALTAACGGDYVTFNNTRTHAELVEAIYKAAEISEEA